MAAGAIGVRPRFSPPISAQVDRSHPLAQGLFDCWIASAHPRNFAHDVVATTNSNPAHAVGRTGPARLCSSGNSVDLPSLGRTFSYASSTGQPVTMLAIFTPVTWSGAYNPLFWRGRDGEIFISTTGNISWCSMGISGSNARDWENGFGASESMTVGVEHHFAVTFDGSSTGASWLNGRRIASKSTTAASAAPSVVATSLGRQPSVSNADVRFSAFMAWQRELTGAHIAQLYADPFCFLRW